MIDLDEALESILSDIKPTSAREELPLLDACGRVLASRPKAQSDIPPAALSAMDGYALNSADFAPDQCLPVSQRIAAGHPARPLQQGSAARIFTGAVLPAGADSIAIQEDCEEVSEEGQTRVRILEAPVAGRHIRTQGQNLKKNAEILPVGHCLRPQDLGLLASGGVDRVQVYRRLRVAILSSGDELVEPGPALQPWQIYNANRYTLHGLLLGLNMEPVHYPTIPDTLPDTKTALQKAAEECDLLISSGGVSVGDEDHVKEAVSSLGELAVWKLRIKPGKPLAFGRVGDTPFFGLPGNPVAAFVTFLLVVRPYLLQMQGRQDWRIDSVQHRAAFTLDKANNRQEYLRVRLENNQVVAYHSQDSSMLSSAVWANALAVIPPNTTVAEGDLVEVIPYSHFFI